MLPAFLRQPRPHWICISMRLALTSGTAPLARMRSVSLLGHVANPGLTMARGQLVPAARLQLNQNLSEWPEPCAHQQRMRGDGNEVLATAHGASRRPAAAGRDLHLPGGCAFQGLSQPVRGLDCGLHHRADHRLEDGRAGALSLLAGDGRGRLRARRRCAGLSKAAPAAHQHRRGARNGSCAMSSAPPPTCR